MKIIQKGRKKSKLKKIGIIICLIFISTMTLYLGVGLAIFFDLSSYNRDVGKYYWWDSPDYAYTGNRSFKDAYINADWGFLEDRAYSYENWTDIYNVCNESWDCSTTTAHPMFDSGITSPFYNYSQYLLDLDQFANTSGSPFNTIREIDSIIHYGDSPMWTGTYLASLSFHYAVACDNGNVSEANEVLRKIMRPVNGLHISTHVSGKPGNLVRFAVKKTPINVNTRFRGFLNDIERLDNGTIISITPVEYGASTNRYPGQGEWEDWVYEDDTSRDQHIGLFFGWGITHKLLSETEIPGGVNTTLRDSILTIIESDGEDVLDCLIGSNWHVLSGEGKLGEGRGHSGASLFPRIPWTSGGDLILGWLSFGKRIDQAKYTPYYNEVLNRYLGLSYHFSVDQSGGYYANNLGFDSLFLSYFLEEDEDVKAYIRWHFNNDFYANVEFHRSSYFNLGWFIINEYNLNDDILTDPKLTYKLDDIVDNLDRFAKWRFPSRDWYIPEVHDADEIVHPTSQAYSEIFADGSTHIYNTLYSWLFNEFADTSAKSKFALGVDEMGETDFVWQRNPFSLGGTSPDRPTRKGVNHNPGVDFTICYWMGLYYGYFNNP